MSTTTRRRTSQIILTVERATWLTDHMVRIVAGGEGFEEFEDNGCTDRYVKLFFVRPGLDLQPPFDLADLRDRLPAEDLPVRRTYTVRWVDAERRLLAIDFVVHGDEGVAGPWAAAARPGDRLILSGPGGKFSPAPDAAWHLFAGDESAAPAIGSALEALPQDAEGIVHLEVDSPDLAPELHAPRGVEVRLVVRDDSVEHDQRLRKAIEAGPWHGENIDVFAHGERESMKALRRLFKEREVPRERLSISGYWARGRTEDRFQAEKREPIGKIEA